MKSQDITSKYLLMKGCTELDNPHVIELRTFQSPEPGDQLAFVDPDGDVFLGPNLTSIADGTYTPVSDLLDFDEISDAVSQGRLTGIRPRHTVWHPPFVLSTLLIVWIALLLSVVKTWWWCFLVFPMSCVPLACAIGTAILFGRYHGPFLQWRQR